MKNIIKLIKNTDFSLDMQARLNYNVEKCSIAIEKANKAYKLGKDVLTRTDAALIKAIVDDDYEAKEAAERDIVNVVNGLAELRKTIQEFTAKMRSFFKMIMNHQLPAAEPEQPAEHIYVLPRQQVFELLKALTKGVKADPDFKGLEIALSTSFLKK